MNCPHCGEKIEPVPKVHYLTTVGVIPNVYEWTACGARYQEETTDKALVTCLSCQRTKVFKEEAYD